MTKEQIRDYTQAYYKALAEDVNLDPIETANKVVILNMPLVHTVLSKYKPYTEDQVQIGYIGLISASRTYKLMKGVPFYNYACFCIEREIQLDFKKRMDRFEEKIDKNCLVYLNAETTLANGDSVTYGDIVMDPNAEKELEQFVTDNELTFIVEHLIKPSIEEIIRRGQNHKSKLNVELWRKLELRYLVEMTEEDSQKRRLTFSNMSQACGVSTQNIKMRHGKVMEELFQRMWTYMTLGFDELFERLRGQKRVPHKLLCFDPGKTTGWCVFVNGKLDHWGQLPECYDNNNVNLQPMLELFDTEQPDFILYEDYKVYSHKLERHTFNPVFTVRLIGAIETWAQMHNIPTHKQMASTAKAFATDEKLKTWHFWEKGMRHARDAIRHGCYFLLFYKKGEDII